MERFVALVRQTEIPLVRRHIARRVASHTDASAGLVGLFAILGQSDDASLQRELTAGLLQGFEGQRAVKTPRTWPQALLQLERSHDLAVRQSAIELALLFGDPRALQMVRQRASDTAAPSPQRRRALGALVAMKPSGTAELLLEMIRDSDIGDIALRGLADFDHPQTADTLLRRYPDLSAPQKQDALQTLASRPHWGWRLIEAVEADQIPRQDLSAYTARQLESLGDEQLVQRLRGVRGEVRSTPQDKAKRIANYRKVLTPQTLQQADLRAGKALFQKNCGNCHRLFGEGGNIGPDITGAQRGNLDYLLENLVDPSAAVAKDYQMEIVLTVDGRVVTGIVTQQSDRTLTIQTINDRVVLPSDEIQERTLSPVSMMPEGLLDPLTAAELRDLVAYLSTAQEQGVTGAGS